MFEDKKNALTEIIGKFEEIDEKLQSQKMVEKVILLMGESKVGKTTLLYYLMGKPLLHIKNEMDVYVLQPQELYKEAEVGEDYNSKTLCPNFSTEDEGQIMIIDMPGFGDSSQEKLLIKLHIFRKISKMLRKVHICLIISEEEFDTNHLLKEFEKIVHFFKPKILQQQKTLSFIFTKVEDENIIERFSEGIQDMKDETEVHLATDWLQIFHAKNKYIFKNDQPDVDEGLQLKQLITSENSFTSVLQEKNLLSEEFIYAVVGDLHKQGFIHETLLLIKEIAQVSLELTKLVVSTIFYEYSSVLSDMMEIDQEKFQSDQKKDIFKGIQNVFFQNYDEKLVFTFEKKKQFTSQTFQDLTFLFEKHQATPPQFCFSHVFRFEHHKKFQKMNSSFLKKLEDNFKHISNVLSIYSLLQEEQVVQELNSFYQNIQILEVEENFFLTWQTHIEKLKIHIKYKQIIQTNLQIMQPQIVRKPQFKEIKKKNVCSLINNFQKFIKPSQNQVSSQKIKENLIAQQNHFQIFSNLIDDITSQKTNEIQMTKQSIQKIINILYKFSMFQQALAFAMSIKDEVVLKQLLEEGIMSGQVSKQFIINVLIRYLKIQGHSLNESICMQLCWNYLTSITMNPDQSQLECLSQTKYLKQNIESLSERQESYSAINFHFILPIIEEKEYYIRAIQQKQNLFKISLNCQLYKQKIFQELLNDGCI